MLFFFSHAGFFGVYTGSLWGFSVVKRGVIVLMCGLCMLLQCFCALCWVFVHYAEFLCIMLSFCALCWVFVHYAGFLCLDGLLYECVWFPW